ncbi:hypothetical protein FK518_28135 [Klebsiella pneumoniae]|nr:hypothetical protein [Klebsiella pneumoniae]
MEDDASVVSAGDVDWEAVLEASTVVEVSTVVASRVDVPVPGAVEVVTRVEVGVADDRLGDVFSRAVVRVPAEVVAAAVLVPGAEEDVSARTVVGEAVVSFAVEVTRAAVDVAAGLEVKALVVAAAGLEVSALVESSVEVV